MATAHGQRLVSKKALTAAGFGVWAVGTCAVVGSMMAVHWTPLPAAAVASVPPATRPAEKWRAVHVLAAGCPCSAAVGDTLVARGPFAGATETVLVSGDASHDATRRLVDRLTAVGFAARSITSDRLLADYGVHGGPWLIWTDPAGVTRYGGGYAPQRPRPGTPLHDRDVLARLQAGERITAFPAFGCATDPDVQNATDPLGLKY